MTWIPGDGNKILLQHIKPLRNETVYAVSNGARCSILYPACPYVEDHHVFNKVTQQSRAVDSFTILMSTTVVVNINIVTSTYS